MAVNLQGRPATENPSGTMIEAPLSKIFNYLLKPINLQQIWPSLMVIKNEQLLPTGGYRTEWVYKMVGKL